MLIYFSEDVNLKVGDEVSTTTAEFPYNNYYNCFMDSKELTKYADIDAEFIRSDYSEYNPRTCRNGGGYGYDYYTVTKINKIGKVQDL